MFKTWEQRGALSSALGIKVTLVNYLFGSRLVVLGRAFPAGFYMIFPTAQESQYLPSVSSSSFRERSFTVIPIILP